MYTLQAFHVADPQTQIITVIHKNYIDYWKEQCALYGFQITHAIVQGGPERFHSVKNGLAKINSEGLVAVADGVRPLVSPALIKNAFQKAQKYHAVVPVTAISDSLRYAEGAFSKPADRSKLRLVQTPQVFLCSLLKKAYMQQYDPMFTDDATVVEAIGKQVTLIEGSDYNIKVTQPSDLIIAEALLASKENLL